MQKRNSSAYNRDVSKRKALRKRRIAEQVYYDGKNHPYYSNLHQYSKNKIHCSCPMCSAKTRNKGKRRHLPGNYSESINYKYSDLRRQVSMDWDEGDYFGFIPQRRRRHW